LVHNHPTGETSPSESDRELTRRFLVAGEVIGLPMVDHVILGRERRYSFGEHETLRKVAGG
jgi:DNA repair protein RadC